jgi:MFS transporter, DHA1 family, inner membrane transport protein
MGLLPQLADGVAVSIPTAGHAISAYAVGVVVGAPVVAFFGAHLPRRGLLVGLMLLFFVGNGATALATSYPQLLGARFLSGIPHGAYFGVASLVAADLVRQSRRGRAVSQVMLGLAVANVLGVPAVTWLGQQAGWRAAYWAVASIGLVTIALVLWRVPHHPGTPGASGRSELAAFRNPQVLLTLLAGAIGFGGVFAMFTYIAPTVTEVAGQPESRVPVYLLVFGLGMVVGTTIGGWMADWSVLRSVLIASAMLGVVLLVFTQTSRSLLPGLVTVFVVQVFASILVVNLQLRLMQVAGDAETIGAAMNHASLNVANALGAWLGGVVVAAGYGFTAPSWVGVGLSVLGLLVLLVSARLHVRTPATAQG